MWGRLRSLLGFATVRLRRGSSDGIGETGWDMMDLRFIELVPFANVCELRLITGATRPWVKLLSRTLCPPSQESGVRSLPGVLLPLHRQPHQSMPAAVLEGPPIQ